MNLILTRSSFCTILSCINSSCTNIVGIFPPSTFISCISISSTKKLGKSIFCSSVTCSAGRSSTATASGRKMAKKAAENKQRKYRQKQRQRSGHFPWLSTFVRLRLPQFGQLRELSVQKSECWQSRRIEFSYFAIINIPHFVIFCLHLQIFYLTLPVPPWFGYRLCLCSFAGLRPSRSAQPGRCAADTQTGASARYPRRFV